MSNEMKEFSKYIKQEIKKLNSLYLECKDFNEKIKIIYSLYYYDDLLNIINNKVSNNIDIINDKEFNEYIHLNYINNFHLQHNIFKMYKNTYKNMSIIISDKIFENQFLTPNYKLNKTSIDELFNIIKNNFNNNFYDFCVNELRNKHIILLNNVSKLNNKNLFTLSSGCNMQIMYNKSNYYIINIYNNLCYYNLFVLIHELGHGFANNIINYNNNNTLYDELYPIFNSLKLYNVLKNNKEAKNDVDLFKYYFMYCMLYYSKILFYLTYFTDCVDENAEYDIEKFNKVIEDYKLNTKILKSYNLEPSQYEEIPKYFISSLVAVELFYQDLVDREKAEYNINKIYTNNYNTLDDLKKLEGINIEEVKSCKKIKKLINEFYNN